MLKKLILLSVLLLTTLSSCDILWPPGGGNGGGGNGDDVAAKLRGTWVWVRTDGGIYYQVHTPQSTGSTAKLELKADNTYSFHQNYTMRDIPDMEDFGTYTLGKLEGDHTIQLSSMMMRPTPVFSLALSYELNYVTFRGKDTLELHGVGADMFNYTYVRAR